MEGGSALGSKKWSNEIYYICHLEFIITYIIAALSAKA